MCRPCRVPACGPVRPPAFVARSHAVRLIASASVLAFILLGTISPAIANVTTVPDDFPTIQAAVDHLTGSTVRETLLVRGGIYQERLVLRDGIVIKGIPPSDGPDQMPRIDALAINPGGSGHFALRFGVHSIGLQVAGPTTTFSIDGPLDISFESCQFDSGMSDGSRYSFSELTRITMTRCTLFGVVTLNAYEGTVDSSIVHGPLFLSTPYWGRVRDNRFEGIAGTAATIYTRDAHVARNIVQDCRGGFLVLTEEGSSLIEDNRINGCEENGIQALADAHTGDLLQIIRNRVTRCRGYGISGSGLIVARDNIVLDCGGDGLELSQLEETGAIEGNVVARCGNHGIRLTHDGGYQTASWIMRNNTVYGCGGPGISMSDLPGGTVSNNIAFRNLGHGLLAVRSEPLLVSCNDWFENREGATSGIAPSASDLAVDPLFCDVAHDNVHLAADSPLLDAPGCGLIGALGQGCAATPIQIAFDFTPKALNLTSRGRWVMGLLEPGSPYVASDIDIASIRLHGVAVDPEAKLSLGDHDRNGVPDLTVRFDRMAVGRTVTDGEDASVAVTGTMAGRAFLGTDAIRVRRAVGPTQVDISHESSVTAAPLPLAVRVASAIPAADGRMRVEFALPEGSPARLELLDVAGRVLRSTHVGDLGPGRHTLDLSSGRDLRQGIYFLRLRQAGNEVLARAAVVR